jgi:phosphate transport system permease protein
LENKVMSVQQVVVKHSPWRRRLGRQIGHGDIPFSVIISLMAALVLLIVVAIGYQLWGNSRLAQAAFGLSFLWTTTWDPVAQQSLLALVIAVPLSLGIAIFLSELAPQWLRMPLGFLVELLAAVPSVVYGLWGLYVFVPTLVRPLASGLRDVLGFIPFFAGPVYGPSRLAASLILAIMILPTISAVSRDVFLAIPRSQREASLALGATQWETIWRVLIPYGLSGILGAVILGLGRALGETMAVTMVIGNNLDLSPSFLHPGYTMASVIVNEFTEATYPLYLNALIEVGLVLFALTLLLNFLARLLVWGVARRGPQEARS